MNQLRRVYFSCSHKENLWYFSRRGGIIPNRQGTQQVPSGGFQRTGGNLVSELKSIEKKRI